MVTATRLAQTLGGRNVGRPVPFAFDPRLWKRSPTS